MPGFLLRGALVEYGTEVLGPLPNVVVFQFNPEQISRDHGFTVSKWHNVDSHGERRKLQALAYKPPGIRV